MEARKASYEFLRLLETYDRDILFRVVKILLLWKKSCILQPSDAEKMIRRILPSQLRHEFDLFMELCEWNFCLTGE